MAGGARDAGRVGGLARAGPARRLRLGPPAPDPLRAQPRGRPAAARPRTGWSASWSPGARWSARRDGDYVIGRRLWDLGLLAPVQAELREAAAPFLQDLYAATRDTVHLAVRRRHQGALPRPHLRPRVGAGGEPGRLAAAAARHRGRQGAARLRAARGRPRGRRPPGPGDAGTPSSSPDGWLASSPRYAADGYARTTEEMSLGALLARRTGRRRRRAGRGRRGLVVPPHRATRPGWCRALQVAARTASRGRCSPGRTFR